MAKNLEVELSVSGAKNAAPVELTVTSVRGREAISELFDFEIDLVCTPGEELPDAVAPGAVADLVFRFDGLELRHVHGVLEAVTLRLDCHAERPTYRARLVPRAFRSTLVKTQQIFMDDSIIGIMKHKLGLVGLGSDRVLFNLDQRHNYPEREFVVQYMETDHAFVSRLAEHRGVSYYFDHTEGFDRMMFTDHLGGFKAGDQAKRLVITDALNERDRVHTIDRTGRMMPSTYVTYDHNYRKPMLPLLASQRLEGGNGGGIVEFGAHLKDKEASEALGAVRAEELACRQVVYRGESSIVNMTAGGATVLQSYQKQPDTELLISSVEHVVDSDGDGNLTYKNRFEAVGREVTFRPQRLTPKPVVPGIVTAVVQGVPGSDGTSANLDEEGRYILEFHFDSALGDPSQKSSRPVRMAQPFGGTGHGMHFPLRPGTEVVLAFTNGDPDRPILLGAVPNAITRTPVVASNKTQNRITTKSGAMFEISEKV
jgi:type VI secretion system secreted protein VgrG